MILSLSSNAKIADIVFINGNVYSLNWGEPNPEGIPAKDAPFFDNQWQADANYVALRDNKILSVGDEDSMKKHIGANTKIVDLKGATVIPGLIDSHAHIAELGEILERINLADVESPLDAIAKLKAASSDLKPNEWLIGQGWDEGAWANNYPDRHILDKAFPNNPVYLKSLHGFGVWVNTKVLQLAGIKNNTESPIGGEILRDKNGTPTGILLNRATALIDKVIPKPSTEEFANYIRGGMLQMAKDGFVSTHQAGAKAIHIDALAYLQSNNKLPIRTYVMLSARDKELARKWVKKGPFTDPTGFVDVRSVKAYYDGALGSRGARLLEDYSDMPGHRGVSGNGYGFDANIVDELIESGFQIGIHAIGDAGNREVLDYFTQTQKKHSKSSTFRHRIEHAQVIASNDFKRFKDLKIIASMEPPHAVEDKTWAESRLGPDRIQGAYAWRTLRKEGVPLTFNSDLPGSDHSIFYALHAAITRRDKQSLPMGGWYPKQSVSIEEAIRAYTNWAAYAAFRENDSGVLKAGYWADLTIMDIDPFKLAKSSPETILKGKILATIVDGKFVYKVPSLIID